METPGVIMFTEKRKVKTTLNKTQSDSKVSL